MPTGRVARNFPVPRTRVIHADCAAWLAMVVSAAKHVLHIAEHILQLSCGT